MRPLDQLCEEPRPIVLDGGMGTELQLRGVPMDTSAWSAVANVDHYAVVRTVHEDYVRAGADVLIANTYAAARPPLTAAGLGHDVAAINEHAVRATLAARESADRPIAVAGSLSHVQMGGSPREWPSDDAGLLDVYREQAQLLAGAGAELIVVEMAGATAWVLPALAAAAETDLPVWLGLSAQPGADGPLAVRGHPETSFASLSAALVTADVDAVFVMHTDLEQVGAALDVVLADWAVPVGVYPNSGTFTSPLWVFADLAPERLAAEAVAWIARGVRFVGGCCGIGPAHIAAVRKAIVNC
jgi:S-methylmethionine-dependent homocysteine/selenocysteine methylase